MALENPLIDLASTPAQSMGASSKVVRRAPVTGREGSSSLAYHCVVPPKTSTPIHVNARGEEYRLLARGRGIVGVGEGRAAITAGACQMIPPGVSQFFYNDGDEDAVLAGYITGAADWQATGYREIGEVDRSDVAPTPGGIKDGILVHLDDVKPENMNKGDGWFITDFRLPISGREGAASTLFRARFFPGAVHAKHRHENCEEIYYVMSGHGLAGAGSDRVEVHGGHFHYIPRDVEHWLHNLSKTDPIEIIGIYIGSTSVADTGYVFMGSVTDADIKARRSA